MTPTKIFFTYLFAGLGVGTAVAVTADMVAPQVAEDAKKGLFRRFRRTDRTSGSNESG